MSTNDHAKNLNSLLRSIKSAYETPEIPERSVLDELVYSFLLWEAPTAKADAAYKRLSHHVVDHNELRVCRPAELAAVIGKTYPLAEERAQRLKATLQEIYIREYAVTLEKCSAMNKRDARRYLETLDGMPPFAAARVVLVRLGGHTVPVDEKLLVRLIDHEIVEPADDCAKASAVLERHVKADDALKIHLLLQAWAEDPSTEPRKPRKKAEESPAAAAASGGGAAKKAPGRKPAASSGGSGKTGRSRS
ncbi:MAG: hypothetical protein SFZ24_07745 [Planctomycetota bacterium]|nr:hypothetical protein [Planctomycetota bacterium]